MFELNKIMVIGNLTRDPEAQSLPTGLTLTKFGIAVNKSWKDKSSGEWKKEVSFFNVTVFGKSAEFAAKWFKKGTRVYIEGSLKQTTWEAKDGTKRSDVGIVADSLTFAGDKDKDSEPQPIPTQQYASPTPTQKQDSDNTTDDLPF